MANSKGIPRDPEKEARSRIGIFSIIMVLLVTLLMLLEAMTGTAPVQSNNPAVTANIQPAPMLNTNITWSTFYHGWNPLEYSNGTANLTLNAQESSLYANPISINPSDIRANNTFTFDKLGSQSSDWESETVAPGTLAGGAVQTFTISNGIITETANTSNAASNSINDLIQVNLSNYPSANLAYDYLTYILSVSGPSTVTGVHSQLVLGNSSGVNSYQLPTVLPGSPEYQTVTLATINSMDKFSPSFNTTGKGTSSYIKLYFALNIPESSTSATYTMEISGLAFTTYPITPGTNATGDRITSSSGNLQLDSFNPSTPMNVTNNGYTVAISQPFQNLTTQQSAVSSGGYVEQVEYQGSFMLPTAPDLSYGSTNLTEQFNVSTAQTQVLDINGVSYLSTISGKNGTVQLLSSVNPNSQTQFLQIVDYTQSQWTSISSPPGIFTIQGIEYYWEEFIIAILAVVGIGAGAASKHASSLRKVK